MFNGFSNKTAPLCVVKKLEKYRHLGFVASCVSVEDVSKIIKNVKEQQNLIFGNTLLIKEFEKKISEKILTIFNFLAVLDLLQLKKIIIHIGEGFNNFWIELRTVRI